MRPTYDELVALPYTELVALRADLENALLTVKTRTTENLREEYRRAAEASGLTLENVLRKPGKPKAAAPIAYRDPNNSRNAWSGRGRKPKWVEEYLAQGLTLSDLKAPS